MTSSKEQNFYKALEVSDKVKPEELRAAYLKLALKWHPDRNPGDGAAEERFKLLSQAYAVLRDPKARARYDRLLARKAGKKRQARPAPPRPAQGPKPVNPANVYTAGAGGYGPPPPSKMKPRTPPGAADPPKGPSVFSQSASAYTTRPEAVYTKNPPGAKETGARKTPPPPAATAGGGGAGTDPLKNKAEESKKAAGSPLKAGRKNQVKDPEDIVLTFFTTPDGQVSLKKIKEELTKTGLGANPPVLDKLNEKSPKRSAFRNVGTSLAKGLSGIKRFFVGAPLERSGGKVSEYDLTFGLALSPEAAKSGTTVDLQYYQDGLDRHLSVKVPPNTRENSRLRLPGQGNLKPDKTRGDLLLTITIPGKSGTFPR
ncbi:MAG: DnaJ domain-containing protein [Deltaproteobacteria bacterium]|jgi:curved DNA-binding protein CbpA|nr:DnaJ domain-containing protein [Deltaproteobacteria bacterium]